MRGELASSQALAYKGERGWNQEKSRGMARMIAEVYDALKSAGADDEKARAAAIALAETDGALPRSGSGCASWSGRSAPTR